MTTRTVASSPTRAAEPATDAHSASVVPTAEAAAGVGALAGHVAGDDVVDAWGHDSFPASDPPANW
jgi:hypothetical protein